MSLTATYHGQCAACEGPIIPGQRITHQDDDGWIHERCEAPPEKVECVCEKCMLVHAPMQAECW